MFDDDEDEDGGFFLLVMGLLAFILLVVTVIARSGDDLPAATVTGPTTTEVAAEEPAPTTAAPETTTTAAPETTTTVAVAAAPFTMWDALNGSGEAGQFAAVGGALGLQADLEALEDENGDPVMRTLFAPSDAALADFGPEAIGALTSDPDGANALVGYHFLTEPLAASDLAELDGQTLTTRTGLPLNVTVEDGDVVLNGVARVVSTDFDADNGVVHIVDMVLTPPTVNQALGLDNIEFEVASATITQAGQDTLQLAVDFFSSNTANAVIEGHTDTDGSEEGNLELSQARAESVLAFLVSNGLDAERFTAVGFGEAQPVLDAAGVEDKEASRRIEFNVR